MFQLARRFFADWGALKRFKALPAAKREVVSYATGAEDWPHFAPTIDAFAGSRAITYVTSDYDDPILSAPPAGVIAGKPLIELMTSTLPAVDHFSSIPA